MAWWKQSKTRTRVWVYLAIVAVVFTMISLTGTAILGFYTMLSWQRSPRRSSAVKPPAITKIAYSGGKSEGTIVALGKISANFSDHSRCD